MKDIRPEFTPEEYDRLKAEADRLGVPLKKLVHDRAVQADTGVKPLTVAQILSMEMSQVRDVLNQIIRRESTVEIRLYEDDVIRLELTLARLEEITADFISQILKGAALYGDPYLFPDPGEPRLDHPLHHQQGQNDLLQGP